MVGAQGGHMSTHPDDDLADLADDLAGTLEELRQELRTQTPRGPLGLPRPPTPRELLRFTDEFAIPTAIAVLEANIRALELLQGTIRLVETEREAADRTRRTRDRAEAVSRTTLDRLDDALHDLQRAASEGALPSDADARRIIEDARALRADLEERLRGAEADADALRRRERDEGTVIDVEGPDDSRDGDGEDEPDIDVEEELDSIRADLDRATDEENEEGPQGPEDEENGEADDRGR